MFIDGSLIPFVLTFETIHLAVYLPLKFLCI